MLLDEYDMPMQEAWTHGYWDDITPFMRQFMNATFKDNDYLERGLLTGITRVSKESILSDLNNLMAVTTTSETFSDSFGFTEAEVFAAMDEYGLTDREGVKRWYDGFTFGSSSDIYNPWSITNYLHERRFDAYWVNTSSNALVGALIQRADAQTKSDFEVLLGGGVLTVSISENISFKDLDSKPSAIWSLLLASGYLRVVGKGSDIRSYAVAITNLEVQQMFLGLVESWFNRDQSSYKGFLQELLRNNVELMNVCMNRLTRTCFSYFDVGGDEPECFYHGFVLGLLASLGGEFHITSNRESGFGRYDVMLEPRDAAKRDAFILEFKVRLPEHEKSLEDTLESALKQILDRNYKAELIDRGIPADRIHCYGFAFEGKRVLVG